MHDGSGFLLACLDFHCSVGSGYGAGLGWSSSLSPCLTWPDLSCHVRPRRTLSGLGVYWAALCLMMVPGQRQTEERVTYTHTFKHTCWLVMQVADTVLSTHTHTYTHTVLQTEYLGSDTWSGYDLAQLQWKNRERECRKDRGEVEGFPFRMPLPAPTASFSQKGFHTRPWKTN